MSTKDTISPPGVFDRDAFVTHLKAVEGFIPHMYKDTRENVTLGIGLLLRDAQAAKALPFLVRGTGQAAAPQDIVSAFNKVRDSQISGQAGAGAFKPLTGIEITEAEAREHAKAALDDFFHQLTRPAYFPDLASYPPAAQKAILDMAYTLGARGTRDTFVKFTGAVRRRDWPLAAAESFRRDVGPGRNATIYAWLDEAARTADRSVASN
jgi:GH24 family phage-related lysozyme (muramidase)